MPAPRSRPDLVLARRELRSHLEILAASVDARALGRNFRELLAGLARLWRYSVCNALLVLRERPDATAVGGPAFWKARGRRVRRGERGVFIGAPGRNGSPWPLVAVEVFDLSQTYGPPSTDATAPASARPALVDLERARGRLGLPVDDELLLPGLEPKLEPGLQRGQRRHVSKIRLAPDLNPAQRASYLVHDYALGLLLGSEDAQSRDGSRELPTPTALERTEIEAAAFVVLTGLGLHANSPDLLAWRGRTGPELVRSLERVMGAARAILVAIRGRTPRVRIPAPRIATVPAERTSSTSSPRKPKTRHDRRIAARAPRARPTARSRAAALRGSRRHAAP